MSSLEKMTIQGIRSYGPRTGDTQIIEFFTPVTLIVGQNGSGKTTIIECLKYATTSVMPPDAKGSSFLFDPKLIDEVETRGQIKLYFRDMSGLSVQVQKNMCNTQKAKKLEFRTIETIISRYDSSDKLVSTITSKCVNADAEVVNAFGVSKAVLEHVIFCHQEDSNWPLSEGKLLKTRFDEIFDATKYIKALELMKKIRLEKSHQIKQIEIERKHLENYKNRAEQLEADLEDFRSKYTTLESKKQTLLERLKPVEKQIDVFMKESMRLLEVKTKLDSIEYEKASLERQIKELLASTKDCLFNGSDAELKEYAENFVGTSVQSRREEEENLTLSIEELTEKLRQLGQRKSKLTVEIGVMEKERKAYEEKKTRLLELAKKAASMVEFELKLSGGSASSKSSASAKLQDAQIAELQAKFREFIQDYDSESKKVQDALDMELLEIQNQIDGQKEQKSKIDLTISNKQATIEKNERQIEQIQSELQMVSNDKVLDELDRKISAGQTKLNAESAKLGDMNEMKSDVAKIESSMEELKQSETTLDKKLNKLHEMAKFQTEINMLKSDKKAKEEQIRKIRLRINEDLESFFGLDAADDAAADSSDKYELARKIKSDLGLKATFEAEHKRLLDELARAHESHKELEKRLYTSEINRKNLFNELRQKETQLRESEDKLLAHSDCIADQSDIERFDEILDKLKEQQKTSTDEKGFLSGVDKTYKRFIAQMQQPDNSASSSSAAHCVDGMSCPVCMRCFKDSQEVDDTVRELRRYINKLPQKVTDVEAKQKSLEAKIERMINLKSVKETYERLKGVELPKVQAQLQSFDRDTVPKLKKEMEQSSARMRQLETRKTTAEHLQNEIFLVDKYAAECRELDKKLQNNMAAFSCQADDEDDDRVAISGDDSIDRIKEQKKMTQDESKRLAKMLESKRNEMSELYERVDQINVLKEELARLKEKRQELLAKMSKKTQLADKLDELQTEMDECQDDIKSLDGRLKSVLKTLAVLNDQKEEKQQQMRETMTERTAHSGELKAMSANLLSHGQFVQNYENAELVRLMALRTELRTFEGEEQRLQEELDASRAKLDEIKSDLVRYEIKQREIKDNLKLREKRAEYDEKMKVYREQKEALSLGEKVDLNNLTLEKKKAEAERDKLHKELNDVKTNINNIEGRIQSVREELALEQYQNAHEKFMACSCEYRVLELAVKDIEKYSKALDRAIMNYHLLKMNEINKIIKQLWRQVYRGVDIDYLEIRSEESAGEEAAAETSKSRRTYNYRVVLVKDGMALDMRGRCSAGQKVLASIIIRLALAETFCLNSGILTLDEPTTNLDRENIESLAGALVEIIKTRSTQKNFQLIIITHDEDFVEMLGRSEYMDQFYRVSKDEKGFSRISRRTHLNL